MTVLILQLVGVAAFVLGTLVIAVLVRRRPEPAVGAATRRVSDVLFWSAIVPPWALGMLVPGPAALDKIAGLPPLPLSLALRVVLGGAMLVAGVAFMQLSMGALRHQGRGAPAFKITQVVAVRGVYALVRNPMALGFYLGCLGGAVLAGSTYMLLYTALGVIPAHLLNLKLFEEFELSLRYGESYDRYRDTTPFLIPRLRVRSVTTE